MGASVPGGQTRVLGREAAATRDLHPGCIAFVMATGIIVYSVAAVAFGKAARLSFMEPAGRLMHWVAAAWLAVAGAFLATNRERAFWSKGASR